MAKGGSRKFVRVALVLATEFGYARAVLEGIIAATRERNLYVSGSARPRRRSPDRLPWLFRVYRGTYGHSSKYLRKWFRDWNPDGVICEVFDDRLAKTYVEFDKPVVELFWDRLQTEFPRIVPDDVATGTLAARHFLDRGFRHFGYFGLASLRWSREREAGFRDEIERAFRSRAVDGGRAGQSNGSGDVGGFTFASFGRVNDAAAVAAGGAERKHAEAMGEWLAALPKPLAVLAANDLWGFELVQAARERRLHVPEDVAVLGVDNDQLMCEMAHPPLSSIRLDAQRIGREAVALLGRLLRGRPAPGEMLRVPPLDVVTRHSTDVLAVEDPEVAAALRHIRQHAGDGLSVKQLLGALPVNRRTLERRFVRVLGHTPLEEIRRVRLERVKALLRADLPIYHVAARCGFRSAAYLTTSFLQATGMTPSVYRKRFVPRDALLHLPPL